VTGAATLVAAVASTGQLGELQQVCRQGFVEPALMQYAVRLVGATREPAKHGIPDIAPYISFGASPRATIHLIEGARALAYLRGRDYVLPEDVKDLVPDVLRHRLVLSYQALSEGLTADKLILKIMHKTPAPEKPLEGHLRVPGNSKA
jgi:MoxR-like ATPase